MDDIADRTLFVNNILRRSEEDVPPIKQRLWDGEDRLLLAEIESLRSDNTRLAKERDEARKVLEPFARYATVYDEAYGGMGIAPGDLEMTQLISSPFSIRDTFAVTLGDLRRAAAIRHKATVTTDDLPEGGNDAE